MIDSTAIGTKSRLRRHRYDWRRLATYALGIGATREELAYLYEGAPGGMKVFPTYAVVPAFPAVIELVIASRCDLTKVVHGGQEIRLNTPIPEEGEVVTQATLAAIYDLEHAARVVIDTESRLADEPEDGPPLFETRWSMVVLDAGGFGGEHPPTNELVEPPAGREPDWEVAQATRPEQALLYRISGDPNPLHADPLFAARMGFGRRPILHGLCTYGYMARATIAREAAGDGDRLIAMAAHFSSSVWPGDTIVTRGWRLEGGQVVLQARVAARPGSVVSRACARMAPSPL